MSRSSSEKANDVDDTSGEDSGGERALPVVALEPRGQGRKVKHVNGEDSQVKRRRKVRKRRNKNGRRKYAIHGRRDDDNDDDSSSDESDKDQHSCLCFGPEYNRVELLGFRSFVTLRINKVKWVPRIVQASGNQE
ncbi:hypothetical protein PoB_001240300 [Plakobranchus ocellatus]|uniref:Uncharacterized protein n=1 Tax=Plakobranchus ocellatus TaxID=259542 RepID=A0AAV3YUI5_9GAST|nr:hypothetical protein PoB_001240300 [Plakobranchus ocellatus]